MDQEMFSLFPTGVRTLIVDDNARFLKKASKLLPLLNFKVATCPNPTSALELLIGDMLKDVDFVLIDVRKATTCGFDFRGIIEFDLRVPVIYSLSKDHDTKGNEVDEMLHTLQEATYIIRRPLDVDVVSNLCRVIAWRKCYLDSRAKRAGNKLAAFKAVMSGSTFDDDDDDAVVEDRIYLNVLNTISRRRIPYTLEYLPLMTGSTFEDSDSEDDYDGDDDDDYNDDDGDDSEDEEERIHPQGSYGQKRKSINNISPDSSSSTNFAGGLLTQRLEQMDITEVHERDNLIAHQQVGQHQHQRYLPVPSYNPKIFEDFIGPSSIDVFTNTNNNVIPAPAALEPCPTYQQQQPCALNIFNNTAPLLEAISTMATTVTYEPQFFHGKQQEDTCLPLMAAPFPWPPLVVQQDMFEPQTESCRVQPLAGDIFTVMTDAGTFRASMTTAEAGAHHNIDNSHIGSGNLGAEQLGDDQIAAMMDMDTQVDSTMVPKHVGITAKEKVSAMSYNANHNAGSLVALDQVLGIASNTIDPTMAAGGAYGFDDASVVAPPPGLFIAAPNGNQLALRDNMDGSTMGLVQSPGTVMDWKSNLAAIFSSAWYEENDFFPVEALLLGQQDAPMHDAN